jgi:peptidoglycan/xylan/chitin deacetylase (PgdA/CDA1 family)
VALTFDCGADDGGISKILNALQSSGATGTFFLTGKWAQLYPAEANQIAATYGIANHTYDHQDLTKLPDTAASTEVTEGAGVIEQVTGRSPAPLFRFPYGSENSHLRQMVNGLGYGDIYWTVDTLGWMGTSAGQSVSSAISRVMSHAGPGEIVLMHCGASPDHSTIDADALPTVIANLKAQGYGFATLQQFMTAG